MLGKTWMALLLSIVICPLALSQKGPASSEIAQGPPSTVREALLRRGISSDEQSLLLALGNSDPKIRGLAAAQLGAEKGKDALPALLVALSAEKEPNAKVSMAAEVSRLGDETGVHDLRAICDDKTNAAGVRLQAARHLQHLKDDYCYQTVETLVTTAQDPDSRIDALYLLTTSDNVSRHDSRKVRGLLVRSLRDSDVRVRLTASNQIVLIGEKSDVPFLERAAAAEKDADARSLMERDLETLRQK
jgi:HEAT repeat protein